MSKKGTTTNAVVKKNLTKENKDEDKFMLLEKKMEKK